MTGIPKKFLTETPKRTSKKPVIPREKTGRPEPHTQKEPREGLLKPSKTDPETGMAELYADDLDWGDLRAGANKYLSHISDDVPPLLPLMRKWRRYQQLKDQYEEDKSQLTMDERAEIKELHNQYRDGMFEPLMKD